MRAGWVACVVLVGILSSGCLQGGGPKASPHEPVGGNETFQPRVVVAIIDTGIQPYHDEFALLVGNASAHPSTYLSGYPSSVPALDLSLEETDLGKARKADEKVWDSTKQDTLYWIPGTKIVGLIGIGTDVPGGGHGTMTSSRATGNNISSGGEEILLVNVATALFLLNQAPGRAVRWAADQPWIDIQSNSWGTPAMCVGPATETQTKWMEAFKYAAKKQPTFAAVHNGWANLGALGYPSQCQDTAGPAEVIAVGGVDNDRMTPWSNWFPYIAGDDCGNPAVYEASTTGIRNTGGGTSSATPFSAGGAAKILLEARRIFRDPTTGVKEGGVMAQLHPGGTTPASGPLADGKFTMEELRTVLFKTAVSPPTLDDSDGVACTTSLVPLAHLPKEEQYVHFGYGEVNNKSVAAAIEVLRGLTPMPSRPYEDQVYALDYAMRKALWG